MAVSPPFVINETKPASSDLISQHPADERSFRDTVESWLTMISDPATGLLRTSAFGSGGFTLTSTDAGAAEGPSLTLYRNSASPAASDILGILKLTGKNSAAEDVQYGDIFATIIDATDGTEDGTVTHRVMVNGTLTNRVQLTAAGVTLGGALTLGSPLAVAYGGTGGATQADARTGLGLGTMAIQNANAVAITGGSVQAATVRGTTLYTNQNIQSDTANVVVAGTGGGVYLRPNGAGSSAGEVRVDSSGTLVTNNDLIAADAVYAGNGAAVFQSNADLNGSVWTTWGNASAFLAINARIEQRGTDYANYAIGQANAQVMPTIVANTAPAVLGSYVFAKRADNGGAIAGNQLNGSALVYTGGDGFTGSSLVNGSYRAHGSCSVNNGTLWFKYSNS